MGLTMNELKYGVFAITQMSNKVNSDFTLSTFCIFSD